MKTFVNFSNHPSALWEKKQREDAERYGQIVDYPFPSVDAEAGTEQILQLAEMCVGEILKRDPAAVMCQGEFTLVYAVVLKLKAADVSCLAACSRRVVMERKMEDGTSRKESVFEYVKFREYAE